MFKRLQRGFVALGAMAATGLAMADVPTSVTEGLGEASTDVTAVGALVIGIAIAFVAFKLIKRAISG